MKTSHTAIAPAIALALALAGSASFAQTEIELQHFGAQQPSLTDRAAVRAEVAKARASGELLAPAEVAQARVPAAASTTTRAAVRAEVLQARADGSLTRPAELDLNDDIVASVRSREEVRREAVAYTRARQAARARNAY